MSALALPSVIAPPTASVPQGSSGGADATGFQSLLDTCLDKEAAPAEAEKPETAAANDDAEATAANLLAAPVPAPASVSSSPVPPEVETIAPAVAPTGDLPSELDLSAVLQAGQVRPVASPKAETASATPAPETMEPAAAAALPSDAPAPATVAETTRTKAAAIAMAETAMTATQGAPQPAAPPLRALAERPSGPLNPPAADRTADASTAPAASDARVGAGDPSAAGPRTAPARAPGPAEVASKADVTVSADEPAIDAAPAAENTPGSTATVAQARETSLSGLSRATIDATAQIAAQILRKLEGRSTRFEMALTPDDLGRVDVKLDIDSEGRLAARLAFDNPAAATDLRGRADQLRRELEDAGFHMAEDAFEFTQRDSGSSSFDRGQDARRGQNRAFAAASRLNAEIDVAQPPRWMALSLSPSGVDLKV